MERKDIVNNKRRKTPVSVVEGIKNWIYKIPQTFIGTDKRLIIILLILVLFGFVMSFSAESYKQIASGGNLYSFIVSKTIVLILSFVAFIIVSQIDYHLYSGKTLAVLFVIVVILNYITRFGRMVNGAQRWIEIGGFSLQPSEIAKYCMVLVASYVLSQKVTHDKKVEFKKMSKLFVPLIVFVYLVYFSQTNLSTTIIIVSIVIVLLYISKYSRWYLIGTLVVGIIGGVYAILKVDYRSNRLLSFLDPFKDKTGHGHQVVQSLYAISMGGFFGVGLGNSRFKALWLPEAHNDFIFALICEELGLLGGMGLIVAYWFLVHQIVKIAREAVDLRGRYIAVGIATIMSVQVLINLSVVLAIIPVTGVTLPFVSSGGTSLAVNLAGMGILVNIHKHSREAKERNRLNEFN